MTTQAMHRCFRSIVGLPAGWILMLMAGAVPAFCQESASFKIKAAVLNNGGRPLEGSIPFSASYRLRPDALGEGAVERSIASASFRLAGGFLQTFPPPGEVQGLRFTDATTLVWNPDPFAGSYHLYRSGPMGVGTGVAPVALCLQGDITGLTVTDTDVPPARQAYFYLVNAVNGTRIEGPADPGGARCP